MLWYDNWVLPHFRPMNTNFDGSVVYIVRNALIHESSGFTRGKHGFDRVMFMPPNANQIVMNFNLMVNCGSLRESVFQISLFEFMIAMENGVRSWLSYVRDSADATKLVALNNLIQFRPNGHSPYITGVPLIS